jgi:outer membrane protein assembly factor BamB
VATARFSENGIGYYRFSVTVSDHSDGASAEFLKVSAGIKWIYATGDEVQSSPALASDGTVYIGCNDDSLYAIQPEGATKWAVYTGHAAWASPAIGRDGTIYMGSYFGSQLEAFRPDGASKWRTFRLGNVNSTAAIDLEGNLYLGDNSDNFFALWPDGTVKWQYGAGGPRFSLFGKR